MKITARRNKALYWQHVIADMSESQKDGILVALLAAHDGMTEGIAGAARFVGGSKSYLKRLIDDGWIKITENVTKDRKKRKILITDCIINASVR